MRFAVSRIGWLALVGVVIVGSTGATLQRSGKTIDINAKRFSYEPNEITLKKGEPVTLIFHSQDVTHGFVADAFHVKTDIAKHGTAQVTFTPEEPGDFNGKCSHFCGPGHGQMQMTIHVTR